MFIFLPQTNELKSSIRFAFIDTPEMKQPLGKASKAVLKELLNNKKSLYLRVIESGFYGRNIAVVYSGRTNVNLHMVKRGAAYCQRASDVPYSFRKAETSAKKNKLIVWSGNAVAPWKYRKMEKIARLKKEILAGRGK